MDAFSFPPACHSLSSCRLVLIFAFVSHTLREKLGERHWRAGAPAWECVSFCPDLTGLFPFRGRTHRKSSTYNFRDFHKGPFQCQHISFWTDGTVEIFVAQGAKTHLLFFRLLNSGFRILDTMKFQISLARLSDRKNSDPVAIFEPKRIFQVTGSHQFDNTVFVNPDIFTG